MPPEELRIVEADSNRLPETYQIAVASVVAECGIPNPIARSQHGIEFEIQFVNAAVLITDLSFAIPQRFESGECDFAISRNGIPPSKSCRTGCSAGNPGNKFSLAALVDLAHLSSSLAPRRHCRLNTG